LQEGGFEDMTIRSLAADLEVAPMSLYRHVRDKDDLLDELADRLLASRWKPRVRQADWREWVEEAAERLHDLLVSEPAVLHVYLRHPVVSPTAIQRMNTLLAVLAKAGFDQASSRRAYGAIHTYTIGFSALEASRHQSSTDDGSADALVAELAQFTRPDRFKEGLGYLLDGIEARLLTTANLKPTKPRKHRA
jgi:AcrR family transcriptional regulator